ncbi:methyl-accepting chemotaxis protein [Nodularia harveyana UHCC-0300]|uniref:Methyl-accepting chemotaxis protein n=1 Tax=Nodularia harveyana UHCC-0300 TaxID=2974287 RepID=A0ABU5UEP8_9CYAN|nr:methyl-accepting chemotaxis protein [Nodularia harveyana]MEA5581848.1 methyl-accepting chemotaxis protein [Nodularia harveyana UHCC-0300]
MKYSQRVSLKQKMVILAIAITTLPVFGMGAIAYSLVYKSMNRQIYQSHVATATRLTEGINRLMWERYADIQIIANSPFFTNSRVKRNTSAANKQEFLDGFVNTHKAYNSITVFDPDGQLIVKSTDAPLDNDQNPEYVQEIIAKDTTVVSQPEASIINMTAPIKDAVSADTIAVVSVRMPVESLAAVTQGYTVNGNEYYLIDSQQKVFLTPQAQLLGTKFPVSDLISSGKYTTIHTINQQQKLLSYVPSVTQKGIPGLKWQLILTTDTAVAFAPQRELLKTIAIATILLTLIVGAIALGLVHLVTQPLLNGATALSKLAKGDFDTRWHTTGQNDLNRISHNFNQIASQLQVLAQQEALIKMGGANFDHTVHKELLQLLTQVESAAKGDLTVRADVTSGEIGTVSDFFNSIVENLREIITQVKKTTTQVNQAIGADEAAIRQLAEEALAQTAEINRTLDAVDQMTNFMKSVAENAQKAAIIANNAAKSARNSGQAMDLTVHNILALRETVGDTTQKVKRLGESSQQISHVVSLIKQIATQTNLLAINASIQAARAGEEAQGFAVVADEVGELAIRSVSATQEIEEIVENIQRETSEVLQSMEIGTSQVMEGTQIVEDAKQSLSQILDVSEQIDFLVQSISTATASQLQTSEAVSDLIQHIAAISQRTSRSSAVVSESLHQTVEISQQLQETVATFKVN